MKKEKNSRRKKMHSKSKILKIDFVHNEDRNSFLPAKLLFDVL